MAMNNSFSLTGNLGTDVEVRPLRNGGKVATFPIYVDSSYTDRDSGERVEQGDWFDITTYNEGIIDKVLMPYVKKGSRIRCDGHHRKNVWVSKKRMDSEGRPLNESRIEFVMTGIMLINTGSDSESDALGYDESARISTPAAEPEQ